MKTTKRPRDGVGGRPRGLPGAERRNTAPQEHHVSVTVSRRTLKITAALLGAGAVAAVLLILLANGVFNGLGQPAKPKATQVKFSAQDMDVSGVSLNGQKIIIDAAHSPLNPGNKTADNNYEEAFTLAVADKVRDNLEAKGASVVMTRDYNTALPSDEGADAAARYALIRSADADMVVSIHMNWYEDETASGAQTFFREQGAKGKRVATAVMDMLNYELGFENPRMPIEGSYEILGVGVQPSAVVECGFLSNPDEAALLKTEEYRQKIADAIADGILLYRKRFADIIEEEKTKASESAAQASQSAAAAGNAPAPAAAITPSAAVQSSNQPPAG